MIEEASYAPPSSGGETLERATAILLEDRAVHDCVVLRREGRLVAYLVPAGPAPGDEVCGRLRGRLPASASDIELVPVSRIPLDSSGRVDEGALSELAVVDETLLDRWRAAIESDRGILRAAVVKRERKEDPGRLHVGSLIDGAGAPSPGASSRGIHNASAAEDERLLPHERRPAISHGGPLPRETEAPLLLGDALVRAAREHTDAGVTYLLENGAAIRRSYSDLLEEACRILGGLREAGVRPQDKVILQLESNLDFIPAFWGVVLAGAVPVPVSVAPSYTAANAIAQKLANAFRLLDRPPILTSKALAGRLSELGQELGLERLRLLDIDSLRAAPSAIPTPGQPDSLALLLLTSGSTGLPKAVMHTHRTILSRPPSTAAANGFSSEDVTLNWMPLDHVVGLVMFHVRDVYLGCRQIHAPTALVLQDPLQWLDWMERFRVTVTWAPNFAYALVNDRAPSIAKRGWDLSSVKCILNGAEAIVPRTARRFMELLIPHGLPANAMRPGWGMSETSSGVCFSDRFSLETTSDDDPFVELGTPIADTSIRFVDEDNRLVDEGVVGRLQVRGPSVSPGYYENPELNREVFTSDGWFATGDLGFLRDGRLTLTGREKAEIIINGINYIGPEIEAVVEEVEGVAVSFTAACGVRPQGFNTDALVVFFHAPVTERAELREVLLSIRRRVAESIGIAPAFLVPLEKSEIPKTETGKIQRLQLKKSFESGCFDELVEEADLLMENARTLPRWFYRRVWRPRALTIRSAQTRARTLVFVDGAGTGDALCRKLAEQGAPSMLLEPGDGFVRVGPGRARLNVDDEAQYRDALLLALSELGGIDRLVYWRSSAHESSPWSDRRRFCREAVRGAARLVWLGRALREAQGESPVRLLVVTRGAQRVSEREPIDCTASPLLSIGTTLPQELPWLRTTLVDLAPEEEEADAVRLLAELESLQPEPEVALRKMGRFVSRLEPVSLREPLSDRSGTKPALRRGGFYVVSGGLGGVGVELVRELLARFEARVLILGRTISALPAVGVSPALQELEALAGEVAYEAVDVTDEEAVGSALGRARQRWGRLDGVFHLASAYHEEPLLNESEDRLSSAVESKVGGALVLHRSMQDDPDAIFVGFSSLGAYFGAAGVGAYSAANRFLSDLCAEIDRTTTTRSYCFDWSTWRALGLSSRHVVQGLDRLRGYLPLERDDAIRSLEAALAADERALVIGLDGSHEFVRNRSEGPLYGLTEITGYYVAEGSAATEFDRLSRLSRLKMTDRFGAPAACRFEERAELPRLPSGEIDREALASNGDGAASTSPPTANERLIAGFLKEVLDVPRIELDDDFFALGGDSILATRLVSRLQSAFPTAVTLRTVFENPTVRKLAAQLTHPGGNEALDTIEREGSEHLLERIGEISDEEVTRELARMLRERAEGR